MIPKAISEALNLGNSGDAFLSMHGGVIVEAQYAICADGRRRFTSGWDSFVTSNKLLAGMVVFILFKRNVAQPVSMVFHVL